MMLIMVLNPEKIYFGKFKAVKIHLTMPNNPFQPKLLVICQDVYGIAFIFSVFKPLQKLEIDASKTL